MRHESYTSHPGCPIEVILDLIGGKWKGVIIYNLMDGVKRYSYLQRNIPKITPRMLTRQLKSLEKNGLVTRTVYPTVPPTVEYALSDYGKKFIPLLEQMHSLGVEYLKIK
jgi:DNA-binding HxlR family transcriptional regulator